MLAFSVQAPMGSRFAGAKLRWLAMELKSTPLIWKCVLQVVENGHPLAEDPISVEWMSWEDVQSFIDNSRQDGWIFIPENAVTKIHDSGIKNKVVKKKHVRTPEQKARRNQLERQRRLR